MKIGIISDVHSRPERVRHGIDRLKGLGVERLILNGDIGEDGYLEVSQDFSKTILEAAAKSNLEVYAQPGGHETLYGYGTVIDLLTQRYGNLHDMMREPFVDISEYRLIFLSGDAAIRPNKYCFGAELQTGSYAITGDNSLVKIESFFDLGKLIDEENLRAQFEYKNIEDLASNINDPNRTIIICHVPARFEIGAKAVDFAYFATSSESLVPGAALESQIHSIFMKEKNRLATREELEKVAEANGFTFHKENSGNIALREFLDRYNIRYAVNGHIHEAGHNAHSKNGDAVSECTPANELFWNAGCYDQGQMGILCVDETKGVSYQNVRL